MRRLAHVLLLALLALTALSLPGAAQPVSGSSAVDPAVNFSPPARLEMAAHGAATADGTEDGMSLMSRQTLIGLAALGGAFTIGLLASGSLSGALGAASVVAITYAVLP